MLKSGLLVKILLTLLLLPSMLWLARVGVADFLRLEPCAYIEPLVSGTETYDPVRFDKARERLFLARSWDPGNPVILEFIGHTDLFLAQLSAGDPALQAGYLRKAVDDFDAAIALRPNSGYLWASRLTIGSWLLGLNSKLGRGRGDARADFERIQLSLRRAAVLGPWEPPVLKQVVKVGMFRYGQFSPDERVIIDAAVARAKRLGIRI